ncbi:MAG: lysylphosphatidylglycerol synthase transmembrane domain-containing protein [Halorhabdus sp.]
MTRSPRAIALTVLQYAVAAGALYWLFRQVPLGDVWVLLGRLDPPVVLALLGVTGLGLVGRFDTYYALLARVGPARFRDAARVDLVVNFVNQLLPSRLSGRLAAPFVIRQYTGVSFTDATAVAGAHTALFATWYAVVAAIGLVVALPRLSVPVALLLAVSTGLYLAAGLVVLLGGANLSAFDRLLVAGRGLLARLPVVGETLAERTDGVVGFTADSTATFRDLAVRPRVWIRYGIGWALTHVLAAGVRVWLLFGAFGAGVEPALLVPFYLVVAYSVTLLPVTPGGIGITEATATVVFVSLGVPGGVAASAILLDRTLGVYLPALAGWYPSLSLDRPRVSNGS